MKTFIKKNYGIWLCMLIAAGLIGAALCTTGIVFETNDDRYIAEILSGVLTSEPDAHVVYVNYLLALPLSWLYRIAPGIPWYGGSLIFFHFIVYTLILNQVFQCCEKWREKIIGMMTMIIFFLAHYYMLGEIQYTSTAALLATAGYVSLILKGKKGIGSFFMFELMAFLLRSKAMLMVQPVGMAVIFAVLLIQKDYNWKEKALFFLKTAALLGLIYVFGLAGNLLGYGSSEWKVYDRFNEARTVMFDFYGVLPYEDVKEILDKYEVSEKEYWAYLNYTILDWDVSVECSEELAEYVEVKNPHTMNIPVMISEVGDRFVNDGYFRINRLLVIMWVLLGIWIIANRNWRLLLPAAAIAGSCFVIWSYLVWQGRLPLRVTIPMFFCEISMLMTLIIRDYKNCRKTVLLKGIIVGLCIGFCFVGLKAARQQYWYVESQNSGQEVYIEGMYELQDYCLEHPEKRYLIEQNALCYYRGSALNTRLYEQRNSVVSGSWYSNSPSMREKLRFYFSNGEENIRIILYEDGNEKDHPAVEYLEEKLGVEAVREDSFTASHGGSYVVFKFSEE